MSRTRRGNAKISEAVKSVTPYRRPQRRQLLKQFEREYIGNNQSPLIEL